MIPSDKLIVSSTEPTGKNRKKVWIQKGKNLLSGIIPGYEFSNSQSGNTNVNENWFITEFIPVEGGKTYYVQGFSNNARWWFDENKNFISSSIENPYSAPSNAKYLRLNGEISSSSNMLIYQGSTETTYEAYIDPKIYIKNNNGVYEEFININRQIKTETYSNAFANVSTSTNVDFKTMFPNISLNQIICFNVEIENVLSTWDRVYANILYNREDLNSEGNGQLQIRSYAKTQSVSVKVTAFYK